MTRPRPRVIVAGLLALLAIAGLIALGNWQIQRRTWKLDLIARVEAGLKAPPVDAPATAGPDDAYRRVFVTGRFLAGKDSFVQASTALGPGWWVLTPLRTDAGRIVLINRGYAHDRRASLCSREGGSPGWAPAFAGAQGVRGTGENQTQTCPTAKTTITGLLRLTEPGGGFLRANDPAQDRWYSRDVAAIAAKRGLGPTAPYFIDADAGTNAPGQPVGGLTVVAFPNNHLVYALTWYSLAMMVAGVFVIFLRTQRAR